MSESELLFKGPCSNDECGSSDAMATYSDGHTYCFSCGTLGNVDGEVQRPEREARVSGLLTGEVRGLRARKITDETCRHFGYMLGEYHGKACHIAPYYNTSGVQVAQHLRLEGKEFPWLGSPKDAAPFGYHAFPKSGIRLVLTEGEIDAMSYSQINGNKYPVWSIGSGAGPQVRKYIADRLELFRHFEEVVIMFDSDSKGREAAQVAAEVLGRGSRVKIAELPLKDASEMLVAGRVEELQNAMWKAKPYRPEGVVELSTLKEKVLAPTIEGLPWCIPEMTALTYGRRTGEIYAFGAGTGVGKTDFLMQQVEFDINTLGLSVGVFFMEQNPAETAIRLVGKIGRKPFHIPNAGWTQEELEAAWEKYEQSAGKVYAYDSFGVNDWDVIKDRIRFLFHSEGVRHFYVDHLTALAAWQDDERKALELIMSDIGGLVKELDIAVYLVSHLATPEGKPHEEGGRVMIRHFKGSRAIGFWCHFMFGMERDQQAEDPVEQITTWMRCLKDRFTGRGTGQGFAMRYDRETAMLKPVNLDESSADTHGFEDEAAEGSTVDDDL